jgi:hypothetical protein
MEDIRQKCAWTIAYNDNDFRPNLYWEYMINFYERCFNTTTNDFSSKCSGIIQDDIGLSSTKIEECILKSFSLNNMKSTLIYTNNNSLLEDDYDIKTKWGIKVYPTLMVNNKTIHNTWSADVLLEAICEGFSTKPAICHEKAELKHTVTKANEDLSYTTIVFIIIVVIALNVILIMFCKRYIAKRISERIENVDINGRINNVVSSYLALRDQK